MASNWTSDLFVFTDAGGQQYVSAALPVGEIMPVTQVQVYRASGPNMPIGFPKPHKVGDAAAWMDEKRNEGFVFERLEI